MEGRIRIGGREDAQDKQADNGTHHAIQKAVETLQLGFLSVPYHHWEKHHHAMHSSVNIAVNHFLDILDSRGLQLDSVLATCPLGILAPYIL